MALEACQKMVRCYRYAGVGEAADALWSVSTTLNGIACNLASVVSPGHEPQQDPEVAAVLEVRSLLQRVARELHKLSGRC
jgi:hypothetical protein